jgi:hypothetical protein
MEGDHAHHHLELWKRKACRSPVRALQRIQLRLLK